MLGDQSNGWKFVTVDRQLDQAARGPRWLTDESVAQRVADAIRYGERHLSLYRLRGWVFMINHIHILIQQESDLSRITKAIENFSARRANTILNRTGQPFWQDESYDHWVRGPDELEKIVRYIEANPVTAGLVSRPQEWRCSRAFERAG